MTDAYYRACKDASSDALLNVDGDPIADDVNLDPGLRSHSPGMTHRFVVPAKAGTQLRDTSTWIPGLACARPG